MPSERVQRRIDRLLDEIDQAESAHDWALVRDLALDVLRVDSANDEAAAYLDFAERRLENGVGDAEVRSSIEPSRADAAPSPQPTSFSAGRYQVNGSLGEGGTKRDYLATDTTLARNLERALQIATQTAQGLSFAQLETPVGRLSRSPRESWGETYTCRRRDPTGVQFRETP